MTIAGMQRQVVLKHERGNPHVVGGDRRALRAQLMINRRVMMRRLIIGKQHADPGSGQELAQTRFVLHFTPAIAEARTNLADHDERQDNGFGLFHNDDGVSDPKEKIGVSIGIERDSHFQRSSSMRR